MISIISPKQFKQIPWKNGKGLTTELAINDGGTLDNFAWRLSIASVVEDGEFSNFSGYWRNLVLISGKGISLQHTLNSAVKTDCLTKLLQLSSFDGGSKTQGKLLGGELDEAFNNNIDSVGITDFNVMTKIGKYKAEVSTYTTKEPIKIKSCDLCFVYSLTDELSTTTNEKTQQIPAKHLLKITSPMTNAITVSGEMMIVIYLFNQRTLTR
jgi:uncharacterized protein